MYVTTEFANVKGEEAHDLDRPTCQGWGVIPGSSAAYGGKGRGACRPISGRTDLEARSNLVLTVGHSTRSFVEFLSLMRAHGVRRLVDVRRFPHSPRHPHFDEGALSEWLPREGGITYRHLPGLGGRRRALRDSPNAGWRNLSFRGYADHMGTPEFRADFERLLEACEGEERACLMCSEAVWWRCHRRMIADALVVRGFSVEHVLGERRATLHTLTPWAEVVCGTGLLYPPDR
jgi:uncharacterized protein (DUF488 family)